MGYKQWTQEDHDYLTQEYDKQTNPQLAEHFGVTIGSIERKAAKLKLKKSLEMVNASKRKWTDEELQFLKESYGILTARQIAQHLNKTVGCVESMVRHYKLRDSGTPEKFTAKSRRAWTEQEEQYLRDNYQKVEQSNMAKRLDRSLTSIQKKMEHLGIKKYDRREDWSKEEIRYLHEHYESTPFSVMTKYLGRTHDAIYARAIVEGLKRDVSTYIEREVEDILEHLGIPYQPQVMIRGFIADFVIEENKVIEVQGDYWHCNPAIYPEPKDDIQRQKIKQDKIKKRVLEELGYEVLFIWELDINRNYETCVEQIKQFAVLEDNG